MRKTFIFISILIVFSTITCFCNLVQAQIPLAQISLGEKEKTITGEITEIFKENLNKAFVIWKEMHQKVMKYWRENILPKIREWFERKKPVIKEEFEKEKKQLKRETKRTFSELWKWVKDLIR